MESWRHVFRKGIVPLVTVDQLEALRVALRDDDPRLIQGATTQPPPLVCVQDWPCEAGDAIAFMGAVSLGGFHSSPDAATVGEVEEFFARMCFECDQIRGEPAGCRYFLNWFDGTPRDEMRRELLREVTIAIAATPNIYEITGLRKDTPIPIVADALRDMGREDLAEVLFPLPEGEKP